MKTMKIRKKEHSSFGVGKKMSLLALAPVLLLTVIFVVYFMLYTKNTSTAAYEEESVALAKTYAHSVHNIVSSFSQQFDAVTLNTAIVDEKIPLKERKEILNASANVSTFNDLSVAYANGKTYNDTDISSREYFKQAMSTHGVYVSSPVVRMTDNSVTIMAGKYFSANGKEYVVYGGLAADKFYDTLKISNISFGSAGYAWIIDRDGVVVCSNTPLIEQLTNLKDNAILKDAANTMLGGREGNLTAEIGGEPCIVGYSKIEGPEGWTIAIATPSAPITETILRSCLIMAVIALVLLVLVALVSRRIVASISGPISRTSDHLKEMSEGSLSGGIEVYKTGDEVETMSRAMQEMAKRVKAYITDISVILSAMGTGDFTKKPSVQYVGDFAEIQSSFREIESRLFGIISQMEAASDSVRESSGQIASGAQLLADGTTRQAGAIETISATVQNISQQVSETANYASDANKLSDECMKTVEQQNEQMKTMLNAMDDIRDKASKISAIIKTIEDIAFQTNILALNASVEAARAGAAGRGFAVVADEVRNLAAKSAQAANNTNSLISATVNSVDQGVNIARETAGSMRDIIEQTKKTRDLVGHINTAAAAQAQEILEVSHGIQDVSDVISQNSATAEQTAAACNELAEQAAALKAQIDKLRVSE